MGARNERGFPVQCNHCGYKWLTNSTSSVTSCPKCGWRVRLRRSQRNEFNPTPGNIATSTYERRLI